MGLVGPKGTSVVSMITKDDSLPQCSSATRGAIRIAQLESNIDSLLVCFQIGSFFQWIPIQQRITA